MTNDEINAHFAKLLSEKQQKFNAKLIPNIQNILGIRVPDIRLLAKEIARTSDWRLWLPQAQSTYMENVMLQGFVINYARMDIDERLRWMAWFVPKIDNWAVCDSVTMTFKVPPSEKKRVWNFIQPYLYSDKEFELRFGLVVMLSNFVEQPWLTAIFAHTNRITSDAYYVRMAVAWLLSVCCVKFPEQTLMYFRHDTLSAWTHNKAIQKSCESFRINDDVKQTLRTLKR